MNSLVDKMGNACERVTPGAKSLDREDSWNSMHNKGLRPM